MININNLMKYKGYYGSAHYSDADQVFHGKLEFIKSLITYEATDVKGLRIAFEEAVNDYLFDCAADRKTAEISQLPRFKKMKKKKPETTVAKPRKRKRSVLSVVIKKIVSRKRKPISPRATPKFAKRR